MSKKGKKKPMNLEESTNAIMDRIVNNEGDKAEFAKEIGAHPANASSKKDKIAFTKSGRKMASLK